MACPNAFQFVSYASLVTRILELRGFIYMIPQMHTKIVYIDDDQLIEEPYLRLGKFSDKVSEEELFAVLILKLEQRRAYRWELEIECE